LRQNLANLFVEIILASKVELTGTYLYLLSTSR